MDRFRKLIQETHRRSLWQVLGIYVVGSWLAIQVVQTLTESLGLPTWFPAFAVVLLIVGLPIVIATAFVQEGVRRREPQVDLEAVERTAGGTTIPGTGVVEGTQHRFFTWRNAIIGGVGALALWGAFAAAWVIRGGVPETPNLTMAGADPFAAIAARADADLPTIAVLPLIDMSPDRDFAFFAEGVHADILTNLSKLSSLLVLSRSAVLPYKDSETPIDEIARELGATAIVEGSVRRFGDRVRISAQLIDPVTGAQVWAENYDRDLADIFAVQSEISLEVARALDATLSPEDVDRLNAVPTEDLTAYDLYLEGREAYFEYQEEANERAIQLFKQAIARDSLYALAWAGLGDSYGQYVARWDGGPDWADSAVVASRRAIGLEPDVSEGHKALGLAYSQLGQIDSTIAAYQRALERNPNNADAANNLALSQAYFGTGEYDKAIRWFRVAERLRPHRFSRMGLAIVYSYLNLYDQARAWVEKDREIEGVNEENLMGELHLHYPHGRRDSTLSAVIRRVEVDPTDAGNREVVAWVTLWAGDLDLAESYARDAIRLAPEGTAPGYKNPWTTLAAIALARSDTAAADAYFEDGIAYVNRYLERDFVAPSLFLEVAMLHGTVGHVDETIEWLEKTFDLGGLNAAWLWEQEPAFDSVRDDPRYMELLAKVKAGIERMRAQVLADEQAAGGAPAGT